ncbi:MAG: ABC transporter substrate-binding protein [Fibrobacterales bacterium]
MSFIPASKANEQRILLRPSVVFLNPGSETDLFFKPMTDFMLAVAEDLDINLEVIYCDRNHMTLKYKGDKLLQRTILPDYILLINEKNAAAELISKANAKGVKTFIFNEGIVPEDQAKFGTPGSIYKNWLGQYLPDDFQAGYLLAKELIQQGFMKRLDDEEGVLHMAGISGTYKTNSSSLRVQGLKKAVSENPRVILHQLIPGYYETEKATEITMGLLKRYPKLNVIWAASDGMALGAVSGIIQSGKKPGRDIITGGIDWAHSAIKYIQKELFTASVGGHFMDGGWSLITLFDYHNKRSLITPTTMSSFSVLNKDNTSSYVKLFHGNSKENTWRKIDFKRFSKTYVPSISNYTFDLEVILKELEGK